MRTARMLAFGALGAAGFAAQVAAQAWAQGAPDTQGGRFSFTPVRDGLMRLDARTGQVSMCKPDPNGWTCDITPDERTAFDTEIGRLSAEVARLKGELSSRAPSNNDASKADAAKADTVARTEAAKAEAAKAEAAKADALLKVEAARAETAKADAAKADALAKAEAAKAELAKAELAKMESAKAEALRPPVPPLPIPVPSPAPATSAKAEPPAPAKDAAKDASKADASTPRAVVTIEKDGKSETKITVPLPSDQQVAEAKSFFARAWQQFVAQVNRLFGRA